MVEGILLESDKTMLIELRDVTVTRPDGTTSNNDKIVISGSKIRFISISPTIKITSHVGMYAKALDKLSRKSIVPKIVDRRKDKCNVLVQSISEEAG